MPEPKPDKALYCLWCVEIITPDFEAITTLEAIHMMKKHYVTCSRNPLIRQVRYLKDMRRKMFWQTTQN